MDYTALVPLYDEEASVPALHAALAAAAAAIGGDWEFLYVDDGSRDGTGAALAALAEADPRVRVIAFPENRGQCAALHAGFQEARGRIVATMDGDLQTDPADFAWMIRLLDGPEALDAVCGARLPRRDPMAVKVLPSLAFNALVRAVFGYPIRDIGCTHRVCRREALAALPYFRGMNSFVPLLLALGGFRTAEVPIPHRPRAAGRAKFNSPLRFFLPFWNLARVRARYGSARGAPPLLRLARPKP